MVYLFERRESWNRIIGVERRGAPFKTLMGRPLPDPTRLVDEEFLEEQTQRLNGNSQAPVPWRPGRNRP